MITMRFRWKCMIHMPYMNEAILYNRTNASVMNISSQPLESNLKAINTIYLFPFSNYFNQN
jgi:hypothetical protein